MKSRLSATHLQQHLVFFLMIALPILTMVRLVFVLWHYPKISENEALASVIWMGIRFDLALVGLILLPVIVVAGLAGMFTSTRLFAKLFAIFWLMTGVLYILLAELITPYFLAKQGIRPDFQSLVTIDNPLATFKTVWAAYTVPVIIVAVLTVLIAITYWTRLEVKSFLRLPLRPLSTLTLISVGTVCCVLAIYSSTDLAGSPLSLSASVITKEVVINEIALNTGFKLFQSILASWQ